MMLRTAEELIEQYPWLNPREDWTDDYIEKESNGKGEDGYFFRKHDIGVIAQELQEILPEAVAEKTDGYLGVRYEKIIPLLIQSIKELQLEIKELKNSK